MIFNKTMILIKYFKEKKLKKSCKTLKRKYIT